MENKSSKVPTYHALYVKGEDEPVAIIHASKIDHPEIAALRHSMNRDNSVLVPIDMDLAGLKMTEERRQGIPQLAIAKETEAPNPAEDVRKGEIKTELTKTQKEDQMRKDSEKELKDEKQAEPVKAHGKT